MTRRTDLAEAPTPLLGAAERMRLLLQDAGALATGGGAADAFTMKVAAQLRNGMFAEARRESLALLEREPRNANAHLFKAICSFKRGDLARAQQSLRAYLGLRPRDPGLAARARHVLEAFAEQGIGAPAQAAAAAPLSASPVARVGVVDRAPGSVLNIDWIVTRHCNFTCSYCTVYDNARAYPAVAQLLAAADKIARLGRPEIRFVLTGGEPTIHPGYIAFVKHLAEHVPNVRVVRTETNLSRTPRFYQEMIEAMGADASRLAFHGSIHFEFTDIDKFVANATLLAKHGIDVQARILAHPEHMDAVRRVAGALDAAGGKHLSFIVKPIRKNFGQELDERYTRDDAAWLVGVHDEYELERSIAVDFAPPAPRRELFSANELIARRLNRFKGMSCYAGIEMLSIDAEGWVDRAVCFRRTPGTRPNIYRDAEIAAAFLTPVTCPFDVCSCPEDIAITKVAAAPTGSWAGTPRNAACPCGSGKRYRQCHGPRV